MEKRYDYLCRLFGTAISFALFGIVGLLLGGLAFPLARLIPAIPERRKFMARQVVLVFQRSYI